MNKKFERERAIGMARGVVKELAKIGGNPSAQNAQFPRFEQVGKTLVDSAAYIAPATVTAVGTATAGGIAIATPLVAAATPVVAVLGAGYLAYKAFEWIGDNF